MLTSMKSRFNMPRSSSLLLVSCLIDVHRILASFSDLRTASPEPERDEAEYGGYARQYRTGSVAAQI